MKNLNQNTTTNMLSKAEMKNIMGGLTSPEVWLEMCLNGAFGGGGTNGSNSTQNEINQLLCESMYEDMP